MPSSKFTTTKQDKIFPVLMEIISDTHFLLKVYVNEQMI